MLTGTGLNLGSRDRLIIAGLGIALFVAVTFSLSIGQVHIPVSDIVIIALRKLGVNSLASTDAMHELVLTDIRVPRLIMTLITGAALALSGAALQGLLRNPLVEPGLIGVSAGSALAVVAIIVFTSAVGVALPFVAFAGGLMATLLVLKVGGKGSPVLILAGVAVNALAAALIGLVIFYADDNQLRTFTFWTLGDLSGANWNKLLIATPLIVIASIIVLNHAGALNAIALGEAEAFHMGVDVRKVKLRVIVLAALLIGTSVSLAGMIGFVGLVVPHVIRIAFHSDNRLVMPASLLGGPLLLVVADIIARTVVAPAELPIGVVTALIGSPFFIFLLTRTNPGA